MSILGRPINIDRRDALPRLYKCLIVQRVQGAEFGVASIHDGRSTWEQSSGGHGGKDGQSRWSAATPTLDAVATCAPVPAQALAKSGKSAITFIFRISLNPFNSCGRLSTDTFLIFAIELRRLFTSFFNQADELSKFGALVNKSLLPFRRVCFRQVRPVAFVFLTSPKDDAGYQESDYGRLPRVAPYEAGNAC